MSGRLEVIVARLEAHQEMHPPLPTNASVLVYDDVPWLLDLVKKQQAQIDGVLAELDRRARQYRTTADGLWEQVQQRHPDRDLEAAQRYESYATGAQATVAAIRAGLEAMR